MENRKLWNKWNDVANLLTFVFTNLNSRINEGFKGERVEEIRRSEYFNRKNIIEDNGFPFCTEVAE